MAKKQQPVDTIFNIPIYFDKFNETFYADVDGHTIRRDSLKRLRQDLDADRTFDLNIPAIQVDTVLGDMKRVHVKQIDSYAHLCLEQGVIRYEDKLAPTTEANLAILKKYTTMKNQGWKLIHEAGLLTQDIELFPKNYWIDKIKELRKVSPMDTAVQVSEGRKNE